MSSNDLNRLDQQQRCGNSSAETVVNGDVGLIQQQGSNNSCGSAPSMTGIQLQMPFGHLSMMDGGAGGLFGACPTGQLSAATISAAAALIPSQTAAVLSSQPNFVNFHQVHITHNMYPF